MDIKIVDFQLWQSALSVLYAMSEDCDNVFGKYTPILVKIIQDFCINIIKYNKINVKVWRIWQYIAVITGNIGTNPHYRKETITLMFLIFNKSLEYYQDNEKLYTNEILNIFQLILYSMYQILSHCNDYEIVFVEIMNGLIESNFKLLKWIIKCLNDCILSTKSIRKYILIVIHCIVRRSGHSADKHIKYFVDNKLLSSICVLWKHNKQNDYVTLYPNETEYIVLLFANIFAANCVTIKNIIMSDNNILDIISEALLIPKAAVTAIFFVNSVIETEQEHFIKALFYHNNGAIFIGIAKCVEFIEQSDKLEDEPEFISLFANIIVICNNMFLPYHYIKHIMNQSQIIERLINNQKFIIKLKNETLHKNDKLLSKYNDVWVKFNQMMHYLIQNFGSDEIQFKWQKYLHLFKL